MSCLWFCLGVSLSVVLLLSSGGCVHSGHSYDVDHARRLAENHGAFNSQADTLRWAYR